MAKVFAPNKYYTGISANVVFKDGVGETSDPRLIEWFKAKGYTVVGTDSPAVKEKKEAVLPLEQNTGWTDTLAAGLAAEPVAEPAKKPARKEPEPEEEAVEKPTKEAKGQSSGRPQSKPKTKRK